MCKRNKIKLFFRLFLEAQTITQSKSTESWFYPEWNNEMDFDEGLGCFVFKLLF